MNLNPCRIAIAPSVYLQLILLFMLTLSSSAQSPQPVAQFPEHVEAIATATPVPTPPASNPPSTPTPVPSDPPTNSCDLYEVSSSWSGHSGMGNTHDFLKSVGSGPACLSSMMDTIVDYCYANRPPHLDWDVDGCVIGHFYLNFEQGSGSVDSLSFDSSTMEFLLGSSILSADYAWYFDDDCNFHRDNSGALSTCPVFTLTYAVSPVSLVLDETTDINDDISFVQFPLAPDTKGAWYTWKASEKAPLVVFDPAKTGIIESANQLFGSWSFGGKQIASSAKTPAAVVGPWSHGFEALGTLDVNDDGAIDGHELANLSLWFDENRNGVSEPGEVRDIRQEGIQSLFYRSPRRDSDNGSYIMELGFKRSVDSTVTMGKSIDWFAEQAYSKQELVLKHMAELSTIGSAKGSTHLDDVSITPIIAKKSGASKSTVWSWTIDDSDKKAGKKTSSIGVLIFKEHKDGSLEGHSLVELPSNNPRANMASVAKIYPLQGKVSKNSDDQKVYEFVVKGVSASQTSISTTKAVLSADRKTLSGKTKFAIKNEDAHKGFTYSWTGRAVSKRK